VAKAAHVSKATVSYVLAESPKISNETASRVKKAMHDLGYSVNHAARVLSTSKTMTIGIVIPMMRENVASISQGAYLTSLSVLAREKGYDTMLISEVEGSRAFREAIDAKKIDGAIIMEVRRHKDERIDLAKKYKLPTVLLGVPADAQGLDVVDSDFTQAARDLIRHFVRLGRKRLLLVLWSKEHYVKEINFAVRFREAALVEAKKSGMKVHVEYSTSSQENPAAELKRAIKNYPEFDSLLIHNDSVVVVAQQVFLELGLAHSSDISVAAIIPDQMNSLVRVPFPTVDVNLDVVAQNVIEVLVDRISNVDAPQQVRLLQHQLHE
jgi:DNA-binding LacI/PurR family transcriptional regulator